MMTIKRALLSAGLLLIAVPFACQRDRRPAPKPAPTGEPGVLNMFPGGAGTPGGG